jgi:hypothetical protein
VLSCSYPVHQLAARRDSILLYINHEPYEEEIMNEMKVARGLGWFSLGLGITEIVAGKQLGRALGMEDRAWLLRIYGLREIAAGVGIFSKKHPAPWVWSRVAGDVLDIATVAAAYTKDNPKKENVAAALVSLAGVTALDYWCAQRLHSARPHGSISTHRAFVADGSSPHYRSSQPSPSS